MFGKKEDRVVLVSREEWETAKIDIAGLKRLVDAQARTIEQTSQAFARAIDTLELRINEQASLLASIASAAERNSVEFSNRLDRVAAQSALRGEQIDGLVSVSNGSLEVIAAVEAAANARIDAIVLSLEAAYAKLEGKQNRVTEDVALGNKLREEVRTGWIADLNGETEQRRSRSYRSGARI